MGKIRSHPCQILMLLCSFVLVGLLLTPSFATSVSLTEGSAPSVFVAVRTSGRVLKPFFQFLSYKPVNLTLDGPRGLACCPRSGLLYAAEFDRGRIVRFTQSGEYKEQVVKDVSSSGQSSSRPISLAFGPNGDLFFTTDFKDIWRLKEGNPENRPERVIRGDYFDDDETPFDIAFLKAGQFAGDLIVSVMTDQPYDGYVLRIPGPDYNQVRPFIDEYEVEEMGMKKQKHLKIPVGLAVSKSGEVYLADRDQRENHILRFASDGSFMDIFVRKIVNPVDLNIDSRSFLYATTGSLQEQKPGGGLKVYGPRGQEQAFISRSGLWGVALCEE